MSRFTVTHHIVGTDTFRRAGQRSCHARAVLNSPVDCLKPRRHRRLVRAFRVAKSGWSAAEDSGVGYADHVAPKGNVPPPLMLFTNLAASPRRQPKKQRCFAQQRSLMAYTYVYIGFKSLYTLVYIVYVTHFVPYFTWSDFIVSYTKILFNVTLYTNVYIHQAKSLFQSPAFAVAATDFQDIGSDQREPFKIDFIMLQTGVLLHNSFAMIAKYLLQAGRFEQSDLL